jgi:NitT/TauT family transport system ATP-binding protein
LNDAQTAGAATPLEIRIDSKTFVSAEGKPVEVIRDLHLQLDAFSFGALIGPSGCGKTTILHIAAGLDPDFTGERRIPGRGRLGMVFQEPRLLPWRTVADNLRLVLSPDETLDKLDGLIETLGLGAHLSHYPGELSLGLARRVAIARAFAVRPDFLLLDEPFVSLDVAVAARLREELTTLTQRERVTTLLVTHDLNDAIQLADKLFFLSTRPASVAVEMSLPPPRGARSKATIDEIAREVGARVPAYMPDATRA